MAIIYLYKVHDRLSLENNTLLNVNNTDLMKFLNQQPIKETIEMELSAAWKKNIWNINNSITLFLEGREILSEYNYMVIYQSGKYHFYFITGYEEKGANQIVYYIRKDTLNTYINKGVSITDSNALVKREHKDRFSVNKKVIPNNTIEGINVGIKGIEHVHTINGNRVRMTLEQVGGGIARDGTEQYIMSKPKLMWNYRLDANNTELYSADKSFILRAGWGLQGAKNLSDELIFMDANNPINAVVLTGPGTNHSYRVLDDRIELIYTSTGVVQDISSDNLISESGDWYEDGGIIYFTEKNVDVIVDFEYANLSRNFTVHYDMGMDTSVPRNIIDKNIKLFAIIKTGLNVGLVKSIPFYTDRKVIELPYAPKPKLSGVNNNLYLDAGTDLAFPNLEYNYTLPQFTINRTINSRIKYNDPKLFNSEFQPIFSTVYSESFLIALENIDSDYDFINKLKLRYYNRLSSGDYSKLKIELEATVGDATLIEKNISEHTKVIDMNNTVATFSTDFEKYINNLYENDLKLMRLQESQAQRQLSKQRSSIITNAIVGAGVGLLTGNVAGAVIGAAAGVIKGSIDLDYAVAQGQEDAEKRRIDYQNKIINMQNGLINIAGSTPELNSSNDQDRIKIYKTIINDNDLDYLDLYFHKFGYKTLEIKKPVIDSRACFNYLQCDFEYLKTTINLPDEIKNDILERFSRGVTIFHNSSKISVSIVFDFEQERENWERVIYVGN